MDLKLIINMDNAAFDDEPATETARLLERVAQQVRDGRESAPVMDINGNNVGYWEIHAESGA